MSIVIQGFPSSGSYTQDDIRGYKVYTAAITQEGSDPLQVIVLDNTIDAQATWTRNSSGSYTLTFPSVPKFNGAKVWTSTGGNNFGDGSGYGVIYNVNTVELFYYRIYPVDNISVGDTQESWGATSIKMEVFDNVTASIELSTALGVVPGAIKSVVNIEIRLYP